MAACSSAREETRVALVAQHGEARLLVQHLAAEGIHHADRAVAHRAHDRMIDAAPARPARGSAPACRSGRSAAPPPYSLPFRYSIVARIDDHRLQAQRLEVVLEEHELAPGRHVVPVDDRDPRPLRTGRRTPATRRAAAWSTPCRAGSGRTSYRIAERPHHRQAAEDLGQRVVVRRARRASRRCTRSAPSRRSDRQEAVEPRRAGSGSESPDRRAPAAPPTPPGGTAPAARRRPAPPRAPGRTRPSGGWIRPLSVRTAPGVRNRGRSTVQSGRSPKTRLPPAQLVVEHRMRRLGDVSVAEEVVVDRDGVGHAVPSSVPIVPGRRACLGISHARNLSSATASCSRQTCPPIPIPSPAAGRPWRAGSPCRPCA